MIHGRHGLGLIAAVAFAILAPWAASAELQDLSPAELENLLKNIEYGDDYSKNYDEYPGELPAQEYYDEFYPQSAGVGGVAGNDADVDPSDNYEDDLNAFLPNFDQRQSETLTHGNPLSLHSGTTKANPKNAGAVLPAYCDPPNPCPLGYTAKDGCLEDFENTSDFSRNYQARQNCLCDSEHMFNCPANSRQQQQQEVKMGSPFLAGMPPSLEDELENDNPFLSGHKLPIAAKKGFAF